MANPLARIISRLYDGAELDYVEPTASLAPVTATTEAGAQTFIQGRTLSFDGHTRVKIEAFCPWLEETNNYFSNFWMDETNILRVQGSIALAAVNVAPYAVKFYTPPAGLHAFSWRFWKTAGTTTVYANGAGNSQAFMRVSVARSYTSRLAI